MMQQDGTLWMAIAVATPRHFNHPMKPGEADATSAIVPTDGPSPSR